MSFWGNVESELAYRNISRKELAKKAGFAVSGMSLGLSHNSIPSADVAVRIAKILDVSVEYLLGLSENENDSPSPKINHIISDLKQLDDYDLETISTLTSRMAKKI